MKALKIISIIVGVLIALVLMIGCAGIFFTNRYLQTPAFKEQVLKAAREELGADVRIDDFKVSLFSGVELRGVTIANPPGFTGNLLTAEAFVLHYHLLPLLHHRVEIEQLSLDKPVITLSQNDSKVWNYNSIGAKEGVTNQLPVAGKTPPTTPAAASPKSSGNIPMDIVLSKLSLTQGAVTLASGTNKPIIEVEGINFTSAVSLIDNKMSGSAKAGIDNINLSDALFVEKVAASITLGSDEVKLAPLTGNLADGTLSGDVDVKFGDGLQYAVNVQVKDADVAKFLEEAKSKPVMSGKLTATTTLTGTGGLPTIVGNGHAQINGGQLMQLPVLNMLALILQMDALRDLKFSECVVEYSISNNVMETPVIRITSPELQITGSGSLTFEDNNLHHTLTITFAKDAVGSVPKEVLGLFTEDSNGSLSLTFPVTGPFNSPKTNIAKRLGQQLIKNGLQQLFK